jgi:hypothetical protein
MSLLSVDAHLRDLGGARVSGEFGANQGNSDGFIEASATSRR